ncbi:hypothetical protein JCM10212_004746 [Sporobolomyces blumeae]
MQHDDPTTTSGIDPRVELNVNRGLNTVKDALEGGRQDGPGVGAQDGTRAGREHDGGSPAPASEGAVDATSRDAHGSSSQVDETASAYGAAMTARDGEEDGGRGEGHVRVAAPTHEGTGAETVPSVGAPASPQESTATPAATATEPSTHAEPTVTSTSSATEPTADSTLSVPPPPRSSASPVPGSTSTATSNGAAAPKRFSSSLSVNKKFLEKAGEKANKVEVKPTTTTRTATPPIPAPVSTSHPRLMTGKISLNSSSNPSLGLSSSSSTGGQVGAGGWKKSTGSTTASGGSGTAGSTNAPGGQPGATSLAGSGGRPASGPVWSSSAAAGGGGANRSGLGVGPKSYGGIGLGRGGSLAGDFPTAAEAAHAKEARARAIAEQMQARERAMQARAAAAAAREANLLQNLDAFRGVHLDPNAHHWDEDEDDFLDTTIEFGDGTQYKITEEDAAAAAEEEQRRSAAATPTPAREREDSHTLREPHPSELARLETPLAPGEVEHEVKREERFGDDYDRSWPPKRPTQPSDRRKEEALPSDRRGRRPSDRDEGSRTLFNDRLGKLEPARDAGTGHRRMSGGAHGGQDLPPHLLNRSGPPPSSSSGRRPSITSPQAQHRPLPTLAEPPRAAWGRRSSNDMPAPSQGRQLPPHLAAAAAAAPAPRAPSASQAAAKPSQTPAPAAPAPPAAASLAPLPETTAPAEHPPRPEAAAAQPPTQADLEELHAREMHAAAERAKKRRQEEEQARLEQIERARKKAAELEEKMRPKVVEKDKAAGSEAKKVETRPTEKGADSWRSTAKPPPPPPSKPQQEVTRPPVRDPTTILPRPAAAAPPPAQPSKAGLASPPAVQPPTQPSAWRRSSNGPPPPLPPSGPRAAQPLPQKQLPPHLAAAQAKAAQQQESAAPPVKPPVMSPPAVASAEVPPKATSPPIASPPSVPSSPSHERKLAAKAHALGYRPPEVSQLDDLMSRIKGAMTAKEAASQAARQGKKTESAKDMDGPALTDSAPAPTVKLPPAAKAARTRPNEQNVAPSAVPSHAHEPRGRGRGRAEGSRNLRAAQPTFENREPVHPFASTGRARSPSPPPAWKRHPIRLPAHPARRPPLDRNVKIFYSLHNPRPAFAFSAPLMHGINPRRLSRDDALMPKKYTKGVPQFPVSIPSQQIKRRSQEEQDRDEASRPIPVVSISSAPAFIRSTAPAAPDPVVASPGVTAVASAQLLPNRSESDSYVSRGRGKGRGRTPESGSWRTVEGTTDTSESNELATVQEQEEAAPLEKSPSRARNAGAKSKLPDGTSIGFYRAPGQSGAAESSPVKDRADAAKMFMVTSELNGEKVEATPREETTAPGVDGAAKMTPSSPVFKPKDVSGVLASPSSAWTNKSLALSVLDPTASSVWSAAPVDSTVHARAISGNQPGNSLQGIVDDDPSEALPNSLAELKSEDEQSNEGKEVPPRSKASRDDAKLRAVAPSFSSFLHDSAAAIDTSASSSPTVPIPPNRPSPLAFQGYPAHGIPPQSTPSPVNPYSPSATAYSPQLHHASLQYVRPYPSTYGVSASSVSPFVAQPPMHQGYPAPTYQPASPVASPLGYPPVSSSPVYGRPPSQAIPHGITNPALIANYGYGQAALSSARYGAVGAGPRPNLPPPATTSGVYGHGRGYLTHQATPQPHQPPSYLSQSSPYASPAYPAQPLAHSHSNSLSHGQLPHADSSLYAPPPHLSHSSMDYSTRPYQSSGSTTMPSPVILPSNLPPHQPLFPASTSSTSLAANPTASPYVPRGPAVENGAGERGPAGGGYGPGSGVSSGLHGGSGAPGAIYLGTNRIGAGATSAQAVTANGSASRYAAPAGGASKGW